MEADLTGRVFSETLLAYENPGIDTIVNIGGTRSGKTYSTLQVLALIANRSPEPLIISVVTQTFPQLRQGAMRDFEKVVNELPIKYTENKSTHTWDIGRSKIEFFSADQYEKVLGAQRDVLYINECNRLGYEVVRQLMVRTSGKKFFDYNPVASFWMNEEILNRGGVAEIHSTYKDNEHLSPMQIAEIESHKKDENWWRVYGLGLEGRLEGLVFPDWTLVDEMPEGCKVRYGLDFGFNDPTALVKIGVLGGDLYLDEQIYQRGLITAEIGQRMAKLGIVKRQDKIIGDSAAAEQIESLYREGWNIHPSKKGAGSIVGGIDTIKRYNIKVTKRSTNLQNELLNYTWEKDKNDNLLNRPIDAFCHLLDASRYAIQDLTSNTGSYNIGFVR